jgi:hypothetical protein
MVLYEHTVIPSAHTRSVMTSDPSLLIDQSIAQLQALSAFLAQEVQQPSPKSSALPPEQRICKEALLTISVLLPKLYAARRVHTMPSIPSRSGCASCDGD